MTCASICYFQFGLPTVKNHTRLGHPSGAMSRSTRRSQQTWGLCRLDLLQAISFFHPWLPECWEDLAYWTPAHLITTNAANSMDARCTSWRGGIYAYIILHWGVRWCLGILLRYMANDQVSMQKPCQCGSGFIEIAGV